MGRRKSVKTADMLRHKFYNTLVRININQKVPIYDEVRHHASLRGK